MKWCGVDREVGKTFARIIDDKVYSGYGRISPAQAGHILNENGTLQTLWCEMGLGGCAPAAPGNQ